MKPELIEVSKRLLTNCLGLKAGETFLVVADDSREELAKHVYEAGRRLGAESVIMVMKEKENPDRNPRFRLHPLWRLPMWSFA